MARYCVVKSLNTEWVITNALDEQQCGAQGGTIEDRTSPTGCGSQAIATNSLQGLANTGLRDEMTALVLLPMRMFRTRYAHSPITVQLGHLSETVAGEMDALFAHHSELSTKVRNAFLRVSFLVSALMVHSDEELSRIHFSPELYEGLAEVAREVAHHTKDAKVRRVIEDADQMARALVGKNLRDIKAQLQRPSSAA